MEYPTVCPTCGETLRMRYPAGDPENGPARMRCPKDHREAEKCEFCPAMFHEDERLDIAGTPHTSWGYVDDEDDEEYDRLDLNDWDDLDYEERLDWDEQDRRASDNEY